MPSARRASAAPHADRLNVCFGETRPSAVGRTGTVNDQTEIGQLETFIGDAKISRKQSPADGHETLSEGVAWFDFH